MNVLICNVGSTSLKYQLFRMPEELVAASAASNRSVDSQAPLPGADSPYQGEMSRRDNRGRDAGSAQPRLRGCWKFAMKPKPQIQFAVWKGRNEHRG